MKKDVSEMVTDRIIEQLEQGVIPWEKPWGGVIDGAYNRISKKPYSLLNQMLLQHSGEYATFKQWSELGGHIRKGEKSEIVVFWKLQPYEDEIEYLTYYKNSLDNGTKTSDVLKQISEVKVNGVLSEVGINKDTVGIFVYLADSKDIDSYKKSIGKIINVESCDSKGEVTSESTGNAITLYKYLIQGKLK